MSGLFKGLFGGGSQQAPTAAQPSAAQGVNVQTSVLGKVIPIVYGTTRIAGNLMLYGNFRTVTVTSTPAASGGGGGKGGLFTPSGSATATTTTTYNYFADFAFALCEGPIVGIGTVWKDKDVVSLASLNFSLFLGTYPQTAWATTVSWTVTDQNNITTSGTSTPLGYNGIAYVASTNYPLGTSASTPNHSFEIEGVYSTSVSGKHDADPSLVLTDLLTNTHYGVGFPSARIASLTSWQDYTLAAGLLVSPAYTAQAAANSIIDELCLATNSEAVWSGGQLTIVPRGDQSLTGNGKTYTPPSTALFDLTDDDFIAQPQGTSAGDTVGPVVMTRKRSSDKLNSIKIEYLDRSNNYNPAICYANDQALIDLHGLRTNGSKQLHLFCDATAANLSAQLQLRREQISNTYYFDLDQRYILLDPMDIITITESNLGLNRQPVRIIEITENDDGSLSVVAEEYLAGVGSAPAYTFAQSAGFSQNRNTPPGSMNTPVFFEPPFTLAQALEVWVAASAPSASNWGGADVYISTDGVNYQIQGRINGSCRVGTTTAVLPSIPDVDLSAQNFVDLAIDDTNTLSVDLTVSEGTLTTTTPQQANSLSSLCYVGSGDGSDGELLAYATATLTAANKYDLTYLVRDAYETGIFSHPIGSSFVRCDSAIFKVPFTQDRIGSVIYIKFLSFNTVGGGQVSLASVSPFAYTIRGTALHIPPADVTNVTQAYISNISSIDWSEIQDFRPILYEIRKGITWAAGQSIARQAHPPFKTFGDGTYWIAALSSDQGIDVYSDNPVSIVISAANVTSNITATRVEDPTWSGTLSGDVIKAGTTIQTTGIAGGTYTIPTGDRIFITASFACGVLINWVSTAEPLNNSIFQYRGSATLTSGTNGVTGLQIFSGNGQLHGNTLVDNLATTTDMGPGQPISGVGISSGALVLAVLSTASLTMTLAATTGSTAAGSTQTITVNPALAVGLIIESTNIPAGAHIATVPTLSSITMTTTALASSTGIVNISIDWFADVDLYGSAAAQFANIYPEIRLSTDGGSNWGAWQRYVSGYYLANGFDARMQIQSANVNAIGVLENFTFSVDVPDRVDHYNSFAVSSLGSTITFRPDGQTTAAFNGGPQGSTDSLPNLIGSVINGGIGDSLAFSSISLSGASVTCYTSTGGAAPRSVNIVAKGY